MVTDRIHPQKLVEAFERGENITSLLRSEFDSATNTQEIIETAYDLQAGSYIASLNDEKVKQHKTDYARALAKEITSRTRPTSILETGVGEGTTFSFVLEALQDTSIRAYGFDISWSRIAHCRKWLSSVWDGNPFLYVASLFDLPHPDSSFNVVYTAH